MHVTGEFALILSSSSIVLPMALKWIAGRLESKRIWTDGLFTVSICCPGVAAFEPGQFFQIGLPLPEKHLHRPYSAASPYSDVLEFYIVRVDGGALTPLLWDLPVGELIDVSEKATGSFTLSHVPALKSIWLVATGTGLAPYIAMLRDPAIWERYEKIVLVQGVRHARDLAYLDELADYQTRYALKFRYVSSTSRDISPNALSGRITTRLSDGSLEHAAGNTISPADTTVMLCGNPDMLNEMESILEGRGLERQRAKHPGQIIVERYW